MQQPKIKAVIFDCDGTLVDSEKFHYLAWREVLQRQGHVLEKEFYIRHFCGVGDLESSNRAAELLGGACAQELIEQKHKFFEAYQEIGISPIAPTIDFATRLFQQKDAHGLKLAVASGAGKDVILRFLQLLNIEHYFDVVLSGQDDVAEYQDAGGTNKPKPYVYLKTAKLLGLRPQECVAIEDSHTGISAAVRAGCFTIAIPNEFSQKSDLSAAHMKIASFANFSVEDFLSPVPPKVPHGVYAAALTPLRPDLSCDHQRLKHHCSDLVQRGCTGIALFGTTGEGPSFSLTERLEALEALIAQGFDPKRIILGNGSSNIADTVELGRAAVKHGCAALLASPPSFYKNVSEEGILAFYRHVIEQVADGRLRILLYHIPQYSGVPISLNIIKALRQEFPQIVVGLKESEGILSLTKSILQEFPAFQLFVGNEKQILESVHLGGSGTICGIANLYPERICSLYSDGKKGILSNPDDLDALFQALQGIPFLAAAKAVMEKRGGAHWRAMRPPLAPLDAAQKYSLLALLKNCGLESS